MKAPATCSCKPSLRWSWLTAKVTAVSLAFCTPALAFESLPEFRGLDEAEASALDSPRLIDPEYTSDFLNYQKPLEWESAWWSHPLGFDFSVGSLSGKEFLVDQRLRFTAPLTERLNFNFFWVSDRDLEDDFTASVLELTYFLTAHVGVAGYTSLSKDKAEDDAGAALLFRRDHRESRLYFTLLDFQRNQRNRESDRWRDNKAAKAFGFISRENVREGGRVRRWREWSYRFEPEAHREFPDSNRDYFYQRQAVQLRGFQRQESGSSAAWRVNWDDKMETDIVSGSEDKVRRQRAWFQTEAGMPANDKTWRFGLNHIWRRYTGTNRHAEFRDWSPFFWLEGPERLTDYGSHQWRIGYDVVLGWIESQGGWLPADTESYADEHRLNLSHSWKFARNGRIDALLTFDLDRLGSGETWEGGAVQMNWYFGPEN